jgi:radical SAM-linked protein
MIDAFLIGDAEERLPEMLLRVADLKGAGLSRRDLLIAVAGIEGFYCPSLYSTAVDDRTGFVVVDRPAAPGVPERVRRQVVEDLGPYPFPDDAPVAAAEAIFDRMAIEVARGCTEGCRFCQAGMIYRPVRERDPQEIVDTIVSAVKKGGYDEVGLTSLSTADYSCISPLIKKVMEKLRPEKTSLSVASLRAYGLDEDLLDEIRTVRATGLTFAPEAGTQRMRDVVNKNITEEDMARTAHRVFSRGWRRVKLYFMIGLPTETDEDVAGIMETGRRMKDIAAEYHSRGAVGITVAVSSHVPKPHTPFQWCAMDSVDEIDRKQEILRGLARRYRLEFRRHDPRTTYLECLLGRGDRRMADVIEAAWRAGARFDSWDEHLRWDAWVNALGDRPDIPVDLFLGTLPVDGRLPWDHLDMQLEPKFLATEYRRAMRDKLSPPCGKPVGAQVHHTNLQDHTADTRILVCYHCGVACDMTGMREERGAYLSRLGALTPPGTRVEAGEPGTEAGAPAPGAEPAMRLDLPPEPARDLTPSSIGNGAGSRTGGNGKAPGRGRHGNAPHDFNQGEPRRYRVRYAKRGPAALTGHLDLVRAVPRILRRAGLAPFYSEGFHPKPVMEFAPPLPLGVTGLFEVVDLHLAEDVAETDLVRRLQEAAPEGLEFLEATRLESGNPKLSKELLAAEYVVRLPREAVEHLDPETAEHAPGTFLKRDSVTVTVERKGKTKEVDLRPAVDRVGWLDPSEIPGLDPDLAGDRALFMRLSIRPGIHARPQEVAAAVLGAPSIVDTQRLARIRVVTRIG